MAHLIGRLTALAVSRAKQPGMYADGGGLYLQVTTPEARSWVYRYARDGRTRYMGLGSLNAVSLSEARTRATEARRLTSAGIDPIATRDGHRAAERAEAARQITFKHAAESYIKAHKAGWRNAKHGDQWRNTLETYAFPIIGDLPVQQIDSGLVVRVLEPIWTVRTVTASRVRQRIEAILDAATARGHRTGENPARWRGHLDTLLPARAKVQRVHHHPALPYAELGAFMADLRKQEGLAAQAMELLILTATRTTECIAARWSEIDLENKVWTIPGDRIKAGREHRIPLAPAAVALLRQLAETKVNEFVFPGRPGKPLSNGALLALLKRMNRADLTAHGFRSTFRDWAAEQTNYPREVAEMALSHAIEDKVEAAYRRGDLLEKRRRLMEAWASYATAKPPAGKVVPMQPRGRESHVLS
jgi:integrase